METNIFKRINEARGLWKAWAPTLCKDETIRSLLADYRGQIERSWTLMRDLELPATCAHCAIHLPGGGCCGAGIEDWYDTPLLLFNLMLGREIPSVRRAPDDCLFLGETGCTLLARHDFCVNYLCSRFTQGLTPVNLAALKRQSGAELSLCWQLELTLADRLRSGHLRLPSSQGGA